MTRIVFLTDDRSLYLTEQNLPADQLVADINAGRADLDFTPIHLPESAGRLFAFQSGDTVVVTWATDSDSQDAAQQVRIPNLTKRELRVLQSLTKGETPKEIASQLGLTPRTARKIIHILRFKIGAQTTEQMVARGVALGLCQPPQEENHPK